MEDNNNNLPETIPYVVHEGEVARLERTIKRLFILCIILIVIAVGTNVYWIWNESQYEDIVVTQENTDGYNSYIGNDGEANDKAASP